MNSMACQFLFKRQCVSILNRLNKLQSCTKCVREMHLLRNQWLSIQMTRLTFPTTTQNVCNSLNTIVYTPNRLKYDRKNPDDDNNNEDFRDNKSDKVTQIKVQTLRLDAVIKAGLGMSKRLIEKSFYDSKLRVNGKKVTKKSMDIVTGKCEIDVIKGPSPDNNNFLIVGRIEVLSIKAENLFFVLTVRRNKNLTIENYDGGSQFNE